ncbi:unnamed protein product [Candidula unifasciata]|uniref:Uncharacterized protein n=1 Tax=Candidula unifasciata TaxID=100452 RepID=A0A8S3YXR8_9EUPU|nr:unnamed protein product [Candidula unifasciata]
MLQHTTAYCTSLVEHVYAFLCHFLLSYKGYVVVNILILGLNLIVLRTVNYYMSKRNAKNPYSLRITSAKFQRIGHTRPGRLLSGQGSAVKVPNRDVPRRQTLNASSRHHRSPVVTSQTPRKARKATPACQKFLTPPTPLPSPYNGKKQTAGDKCDETLDEITWACDESRSSLANMTKAAKYCDSQVQTPSAKDVRVTKSSHVCRRMGKSTDVREEARQEDEGNILSPQENQQKSERVKQGGKKRQKDEDRQNKTKSVAMKKKTGKLKQRHKKVSRGVNTLQQTPSGQQHDFDGDELGKMVSTDLRAEVNREMSAPCVERKVLLNEARAKRMRMKQLTSPRIMETLKNSSGDSKNSMEESDLDLGGSEQFHGNRSESSLVCKRDSWIWFSPDMRPSVEDFAARQRKFRSRDPRVAELAFEISRQEEMNRDIERAAESLIDSSSPSTCKLHDARVLCGHVSQKSLCGAMKTRASRKSRVTPYALPEVNKLPVSSVSNLASGDHAAPDSNEYNDGVSAGKAVSSDLVKILPTKTTPDKQAEKVKDSRTPTPKRRKARQKMTNQQTRSQSQSVVCAEKRSTPPVRSEHPKHEANPSPPEGGSVPHPVNWYNSPAASVIRRMYTPSRYSPLYDNTTLVCSTQCSLCSLVSSSLEHTKANPENNRATKTELTDEDNQRQSRLLHNGQHSSPVEIKHSPGEINLLSAKYTSTDKLTSPKRRKYKELSESSLMSKEEAESCPESPCNLLESYRNRLSPRWRSSRSSPRKRRFSDRVVTCSSRLTPESRMESYKCARRSPQLTFSTGESESDSVYRDKSVGPDASYRQCMISKEVNTTVQRLLFDTEKSSSSHSPSSRSRVPFPDVNTDDDCNKGPKCDTTNIINVSHVRESCTQINISRNSPPNVLETGGSKQDSGSEKHSSCLHEDQLMEVMNPPTSFITSASQTCCACHKTTQKFTNIYARDYYLGKKVTLKKQREARASVHSSKWKKLDIAWCANTPCALRSSQNKSRLSSSKRDCSFTRESLRHKPGMKMLTYASRHSQRFHTSVGCQVTQTVSATSAHSLFRDSLAFGANNDQEMNRSAWKLSPMSNSCTLQAQSSVKCKKPKVGFYETCDKKTAIINLPSPYNSWLPESSIVSPSKKPHVQPRSTGSAHRCKKEDPVQTDTCTLLATVSKNNSSSNVSYPIDKSIPTDKPGLFSKTAQFYFVRGTKLSPNNSRNERASSGNAKLTADLHIDRFQNSRIPGPQWKSSVSLEPNTSEIISEIKITNKHESKDNAPAARTTNPVIPACFAFSGLGKYQTRVTTERSSGCSQQDVHDFDKQQMHPVVSSNAKSQEVTDDGMHYSDQNPTGSSILPHPFTSKGDNPREGRVMAREDGRASTSELLKHFDADTADVDQCSSTTPILASAVKQCSNPDSGYDESLSEKANGDGSFQTSVSTAVESYRPGFSPQWFRQHMCNLEYQDTKSWSVSPVSEASPSSDHAHRSHMSNDCDSEQDTLPSLSDDTFQTAGNCDPFIHQLPDNFRCDHNAQPFSFIKDIARQGIYQHSSPTTLTEAHSGNVFTQDLTPIPGKNKAHHDVTWPHNLQHTVGDTGSKRQSSTDSNRFYPNESNLTVGSEMVSSHTEMIPMSPASVGSKQANHSQEMTHVLKMSPEDTSHNADLSNTSLGNIGLSNTAPAHFSAQVPTILHFPAKSSETFIVDTEHLETATQANTTPTGPRRTIPTPERHGAELSRAQSTSPSYSGLPNSRVSNLEQSDKGIANVWSTKPQNEQSCISALPTFESQDSKETYATSRLRAQITTNTVLDLSSSAMSSPDENAMDVPGNGTDLPDKDRGFTGDSDVKTVVIPCRVQVCAAATLEDELPESIMLPPTSSDEEDATGADGCSDTLAYTPDNITNFRSTNDDWATGWATTTCTENTTRDPQCWQTDKREHILTNEAQQNNSKQRSARRISNQAKSKVFISDRSMAFSEILKRF